MHKQWFRAQVGAAAVAAMLLAATATADGGGSDRGSGSASKLAPVHEVIALGDYTTAINKLQTLREQEPNDADVLNLLGFSHRKLGHFEQALEYYQAALRIEPNHRGANEYLGELYLETGQLGKAEERLAVLDKECFFPCSEYRDLKRAIKDYKKKNSTN